MKSTLKINQPDADASGYRRLAGSGGGRRDCARLHQPLKVHMKTKEIIETARQLAKPFRVSKGKNFRLKDVERP
jgi:hypothetical protein